MLQSSATIDSARVIVAEHNRYIAIGLLAVCVLVGIVVALLVWQHVRAPEPPQAALPLPAALPSPPLGWLDQINTTALTAVWNTSAGTLVLVVGLTVWAIAAISSIRASSVHADLYTGFLGTLLGYLFGSKAVNGAVNIGKRKTDREYARIQANATPQVQVTGDSPQVAVTAPVDGDDESDDDEGDDPPPPPLPPTPPGPVHTPDPPIRPLGPQAQPAIVVPVAPTNAAAAVAAHKFSPGD